MFNPTVIRLITIGNLTGMVIDNIEGDIYFQVYAITDCGKTALIYTMPWTSQLLAIEDYEAWEYCTDNGYDKPHRFSYRQPIEDNDDMDINERVEPHITF